MSLIQQTGQDCGNHRGSMNTQRSLHLWLNYFTQEWRHVTVTEVFLILNNGVKQWCVLVSTLFIIVLPAMLEKTFQDKKDGVYIQSRQDVDLFNVSHFLARTTSTFVLISELLFEDYSALLVLSLRESQQTINGTASQPVFRRHPRKLRALWFDSWTSHGRTRR